MYERVASPRAERIKRMKALATPRLRAKTGRVLVEGARFCATALAAGAKPCEALCDEALPAREADLLARLAAAGCDVAVAPTGLLKAASDTLAPQGLLVAFAEPAPAPLFGTSGLWLVLDAVADPGNVGNLVRSAAAAGCAGVVAITGTADPYAAKAVRASAGCAFVVPLAAASRAAALAAAKRQGVSVVTAEAGGGTAYDRVDWHRPALAIVVGNEAGGVDPGWSAAADSHASIPISPQVESLNAAAAGAILLFEAARCRRPT